MDRRTDGRVYRIPCLLFCRWVVWRSPEPSWWPIASLVSLICTHRWTRPTQWTNVAHRVVLRKGSSRTPLLPPHAPFSVLSSLQGFFFFHLSPGAGSAFSSLFLRLVTSPPYFIGIYLSWDVISFVLLLFFFFHRVSLVIFSFYCRLLFHDVFPLLYSLFLHPLVYDIGTSFCPRRCFNVFLPLNRWVFSSVLHLGRYKKKTVRFAWVCSSPRWFFWFFN